MSSKFILSAIFAVSLCAAHSAKAQGVAFNTDGSAADASAILDVKSTTQGMLIPRMDSAHRVAITTPATGLMVYQTDGVTPGFYYYSGSAWAMVAGAAANTTLQGNTFNGINQLVQTNGSGQLPAISGANLTNLNAANLTGTAAAINGNAITNINPANLTASGTLPVENGSNLTNLNAAHLTGTSAAIDGNAITNINPANLAASGTLPAENGSNLTSLNATHITSGTVPLAQLGTNTPTSSLFLKGDNTWATPSGGVPSFSLISSGTTLPNASAYYVITNAGTVALPSAPSSGTNITIYGRAYGIIINTNGKGFNDMAGYLGSGANVSYAAGSYKLTSTTSTSGDTYFYDTIHFVYDGTIWLYAPY